MRYEQALGSGNQFFRVLFGLLAMLAEFARATDGFLDFEQQILLHGRTKKKIP